jgi:DNA-nicking Smr family endonuclease
MLGKPPPTAMLDLHGVREGDAWLKLRHWLSEAQTEDHRCVLVITGKGRGYGPDANMGVLKAQIAVWLAAHPSVLGFHTALPRDGGTGAVYVLLRRYGH